MRAACRREFVARWLARLETCMGHGTLRDLQSETLAIVWRARLAYFSLLNAAVPAAFSTTNGHMQKRRKNRIDTKTLTPSQPPGESLRARALRTLDELSIHPRIVPGRHNRSGGSRPILANLVVVEHPQQQQQQPLFLFTARSLESSERVSI